jgi:hypothetical protein
MLSQSQFLEIKKRSESDQSPSIDTLLEDRALLLREVERLTKFVKNFSERVNEKLDALESDMLKLENENERLRNNYNSSNLERDICVSLIAKMAALLKISVGIKTCEFAEKSNGGNEVVQLQNRVIVDLPSGQVSWDYLESEGHLFEGLPEYSGHVEMQEIQDIYFKIMNPNLESLSSK